MEDWTKMLDQRFINGFDLVKFTKSNPLIVKLERVTLEKVYDKSKKEDVNKPVLWFSYNGKPLKKGVLLVAKIAKPMTVINNLELDPEKWIGSTVALWQNVEKHFGIEAPVLKAGVPRNR